MGRFLVEQGKKNHSHGEILVLHLRERGDFTFSEMGSGAHASPLLGAWQGGLAPWTTVVCSLQPQPHIILLVEEELGRSSGRLLHSCTKLLRALVSGGWSTPWTGATMRLLSVIWSIQLFPRSKSTGGPVNEVGTLANTMDPTKQRPS